MARRGSVRSNAGMLLSDEAAAGCQLDCGPDPAGDVVLVRQRRRRRRRPRGLSPAQRIGETRDAEGSSGAADAAGRATRPRDDAGVGVPRSARRGDGRADPRGGVHGRAELGEGFAPLRASFPGRRGRPAWPWRRITLRSRFRLEDCADDFAALAGSLYRQVHRRGLFHGRHGGPGAVPAAPRAVVGPGAVLYRPQCARVAGGAVDGSDGAGGGRRPAMEPNAAADGCRGLRGGAAGPH